MLLYRTAIEDIITGFRNNGAWRMLAAEDLRLRYRRTYLGVLWLTATFSLFMAAKTFVFGSIMDVPLKEYTLYMSCAFLVWIFINNTMVDACTVWINAEGWMRGVNIPKSTFVYLTIYRNLVTASYSAIACAAIFMLFRHQFTWHALVAFPALLVILLNAGWVSFFMGVIATRYRDVIHMIKTGMGIMFFMTPILWIPKTMGPKFELFALYNPFAHMIAIFRDPLVYGTSDPISWAVCLTITFVGWAVSFVLFTKFRSRLIFWF